MPSRRNQVKTMGKLATSPFHSRLPSVPTHSTTPGRWVDAGDLHAGDGLLLCSGRVAPVRAVRIRPYHEKVYNFEVDELHCYAVGWNSALVHNANGIEGGEAGAIEPAPAPPEAAAEVATQEVGQQGETVMRFDTKRAIRGAEENGIAFDAERGNGIPTTSTDIEPVNPDHIRQMTGARNADYWMEVSIEGKKVLRRSTKAGHKEILIQEDILPEDIQATGRTRRSRFSPEE